MGNNWDKEEDQQEDKTVGIFGEAEEKTVRKEAVPIPVEVKEADKASKEKSGGKGLTVFVAVAVVVVGIAGITAWQMKEKSAAEAAQMAEIEKLEAEEAEKKRLEEEKAEQERAEAEEAERLKAEEEAEREKAEALAEENQKYEGNEKKARELYELLCDLGEEEGFPAGPVGDIYKLLRCYNNGEDIKEVTLTEENDVIDRILKLQEGAPIEETYLMEKTEDGKQTLLYMNTEKSIYCVSEDTGLDEVKNVTIYYDVKVDDMIGLTDYWVYRGLLSQGKADDVGTFVHIYDEIVSNESAITSETDAYVVDQSNDAFQFYDIYNNEGGRRMETEKGKFDDYSVPEWEFGED